MLPDINERTPSSRYPLTVRSFPGANAEDLQDYIKPVIKRSPEEVILVVGAIDIERKQVSAGLQEMIVVVEMIKGKSLNGTW